MHAGTPLIAGSSQLTLAKWASINNAPWCKPCYTRTFKRESEPDAALAKSDEVLRVSVSRPRRAHASSNFFPPPTAATAVKGSYADLNAAAKSEGEAKA